MSQSNQNAEKAVYDALCVVLNEIPGGTSKTTLKARIQDHATEPGLADVIQVYGLLGVKKTALILHEKAVFSSRTIAQQYFQAAIQGVEGSPDAAIQGAEDSPDAAIQGAEDSPDAAIQGAEDSPDAAPCDSPSSDKEIHLSAETRVPLSAQHHLLTTVQLELEAACFEFARAKMPAVLEKNDWTCAEATELNLIARALGKYQKPLPGVARLPRGVTAGKVLRAMENIRHAAVHREYLKAKDLWAMLRDGESLLILLKNEGRLASMKSLREEVTKYILKLKEDETDFKKSIATAHNFAAVQIARLRQQEAEAVAQAEARRAAFRCSYGEQITALVANFHVKGATQIRQPSFEAAAAAFLLFFARFMRSAFMLVFDILCRLYAVLAGIFL